MDIAPIQFTPYNWLKDAAIYNKRNEKVPSDWLMENSDIIVLLFTAQGIDKDGIIEKFYEIYENSKYVNLPIEVIFVPMGDTAEDATACFEEQANWFTLRFDDILVPTLKFMYGITCIPHLYVVKTNCTVVSTNGIEDLVVYGKNAMVSWLSSFTSTKAHRKMSKDASMYGERWRYLKAGDATKHDYHRKFSKGVSSPKL